MPFTSRSRLIYICLYFPFLLTSASCTGRGRELFSPEFENQQKLQQKNVCASYPDGFSRLLSPEVEALQTPLETRTTRLLQKFVTSSGLVKYDILTSSPENLKELSDLVVGFASQLAPAFPFESQQKAVWINLYNLATLQLIAKNYTGLLGGENAPFPGVKSIQNIGELGDGVWNVKEISTSLGYLSLNEIEKQIQKARDPRFHFAINCASLGCPPLLDAAYIGLALDSQLNERTCAYVNSGKYTIYDNLDPEAPVVFLSKIFDWYGADFGNLYDFLNNYLSDINLQALGNLNRKRPNGENFWGLEYEAYSWELNEESVD